MAASDSNVPQRQSQPSNQPPPQNPTPTPTPVQHPASSASPSASSSKSHLTHKNQLHEYAQRSGISPPVYRTVNEGMINRPVFRSAVLVGGVCYTSPDTFPGRKAAEQDAARLAMISLTEKIKDEVRPIPPIPSVTPVHEDLMLYKMMLNEYRTKRNIEPPTYHTFQGKTKVPFFVSSLVFNGVTFTGEVAKRKKEAEQLAARAVVQSLLGDSESAPIMLEILRSKNKLAHKSKEPAGSHASLATSAVNAGQSYVISTDTPIAAAPEASLGMHPPHHEFIKRKREEPASQATPQLPITSLAAAPTSLSTAPTSLVAAPTSLPPTPTSLGVSPTSCAVLPASKKRRKNIKAEKNLQNNAHLPVGKLNLNQRASCSVSQ
ncbi:double-stranded RNA-binding protein 4 [Pyrus x bretschneideri]|uniref:double-stranded RNA-binding protein 4 n=1 Tax=Pyrus x bretschneideri TaxID=225117 RepID=UPI00202DF876|nr:double-stranded RNA-binding protein 4 [Pyrus x bretschneideri]